MTARRRPEYVTSAYIAHALGVSRQAFANWHKREAPDMPQPAAVAHGAKRTDLLWLPEDVDKWKRWLASRSEPEYKVLLAEQHLARLRARIPKRTGE